MNEMKTGLVIEFLNKFIIFSRTKNNFDMNYICWLVVKVIKKIVIDVIVHHLAFRMIGIRSRSDKIIDDNNDVAYIPL